MSLSDNAESVSIQIRLRRATIEYGYVSVEVTQEMIGPDGKLDVEGLFQRAQEWGREPQMAWYCEERIIEPHPTQQTREPHEKILVKGQNGFELV